MDQELVNGLVALAGGLLTLIITFATNWLHKKTAAIKNDYARGVADRARDAVTQAIFAVQQTYVEGLKDTNGDGKLSRVEAHAARQLAVKKAKSYLGKDGLKALVKIAGGEKLANGLLADEVEAQLGKLKS